MHKFFAVLSVAFAACTLDIAPTVDLGPPPMSIGTVTPGSYTTVTPDVNPPLYTSIQVPSPTMPVVAADIATLGLEVMNVQAAVNRPATDTTTRWQVAANHQERWQKATPTTHVTASVPDWTVAANASGTQVTLASNATMQVSLDLPDGCLLSIIRAQVIGAGGHGAFPIAGFTPFGMSLVKFNPLTGATTVINSATDGSVSAAAYQAAHPIEINSLSEIIDNVNYTYTLNIAGEYGTGSIAGGAVYGVWTYPIVSDIDPGR